MVSESVFTQRSSLIKLFPFFIIAPLIGYLISVSSVTYHTGWFVPGSFFGVFLACLFVGCVATWLTACQRPTFLLGTFLIAFLIRTVLAIGFYYYLLFYYGYSGFEMNDDLWWDFHGRLVASGGLGALQTQFSAGYILFNAVIYKLGGPFPLNVRVANAMVGALIPVVVYHLSKKLFRGDERLARRAAKWMIWWPSHLVFSGLQQKDIVLALSLTAGIGAVVHIYREGLRIVPSTIFVASMLILVSMRALAADLLALTAIFLIIYWIRASKRVVVGTWLLFLLLGISIVIAITLHQIIGFGSIFGVQEEYFLRSESFFESVQNGIQKQGAGITSLLFGSLAPLRILIGSFVYLISPFPPQFLWHTNFADSLLSIFTPVWFLLLPYLFVALFHLVRRPVDRLPLFLLLPVAVSAAANAIIVAGTIARQRVMVEPLMLLLAAWVFEKSSNEKHKYYFCWSIGIALFSITTYVFLRKLL